MACVTTSSIQQSCRLHFTPAGPQRCNQKPLSLVQSNLSVEGFRRLALDWRVLRTTASKVGSPNRKEDALPTRVRFGGKTQAACCLRSPLATSSMAADLHTPHLPHGDSLRAPVHASRPQCTSSAAPAPAPVDETGRPLIKLEQLVRGRSFADVSRLLESPPYGLRVRESVALPELYSVSYDMLAIIRKESTWQLPEVRQARGIILEKETNRVVCRPFDKFFNAGEPDQKRDPLDWATARVYEKLDGSLMKAYFYKGAWRVATNRTVDASDAKIHMASSDRTFRDVFDETWPQFPAGLHPDYTYMFELCHPETRVVVPHAQGRLVYLGARHMPTHREVFPEDLPVPGLDLPQRFDIASEEDCLALAAKLPFSEEGFVAVDSMFRRAKIKSPAYLWLAHAGSNPSKDLRTVVFNVLLQGEVSEASLLPGIGPLFEPMQVALDQLLDHVLEAWTKVKDIELQKDFALTLQKDYRHVMSMFFHLRKEVQRRATVLPPNPTLSDADVKQMAMEYWLASQDEGAAVKAALAFEIALPEISQTMLDGFYVRQGAVQADLDAARLEEE
ncbi:hypothetical protein KFL_000480200 [Klebsormidium nitens]|uniref:T4 RNA ligase 1-like N-terminal domain-containing protein n=1 Tax=Klebsormidium nitens TaxID=105231 RepID=A0A1Y1HSL9_KLENI|nr:hypothetical protein KFL_000480200 [Klebsormidium nitens]|eukprot:GAQ80179.1 hypothetical protein KFL_000480200 [Klebsormidium nitens]